MAGQPRTPLSKYPLTYRDGLLTPDPFCLLDVLAAAGAAKLTGERFAFRMFMQREDVFPTLNAEHAQTCLDAIRNADPNMLALHDLGPLDFLRGAGQLPTLAQRLRVLPEIVSPDDIIAWTEHRATKRCSLRLETRHVSDVLAAHRWIGSEPIPRYSHPGRNALAAYVLLGIFPHMFVKSDRPQHEHKFFDPRQWCAPTKPTSYESWYCAMHSGPRRRDTVFSWITAEPMHNGKMVCLGHIEATEPLNYFANMELMCASG